MKYFLIVVLIIFVRVINTADNVKELKDWTFEYSGFVKLNTINFPKIGKVIQITNDFTCKDSLGNYGKGVCYGTVVSSSEGGDNLKYFLK